MKASKTKKPTKGNKRFAASLLFQYRVTINGNSGIRRLCEKQIIQFKAANAKAALHEAKSRAIAKQHDYKNSDGNQVHFEFVGVRDLLCLDPGCEPDEVWYQTIEMVKPMERRDKLIPSEDQLNAIRNQD
jgi:Domain of unknown function (DUF4288)